MVLEMALLDEAMDYVDVVCETGLTVDMLHALAYRGAAFAEAALTRWMMEGLRTLYSDGALESEWLAVLASSSDVMTFYPYIAHLGPLLYKRCTERTFELLFPTHPGADHYLARKARCLGDREGDPDRDAVAYVRGLVARGIDRHRAMGVAMDRLAHWALLTDEEQRTLVQAYVASPGLNPQSIALASEFTQKLAQCTLSRVLDTKLIDAMRERAKAIEPLVPY